ncbi:MAG: hypothetical protein ISR52_02560 [Rhodospirillales bacterium]|nr:hypothetical protein [Rhodospirillales bacterium]
MKKILIKSADALTGWLREGETKKTAPKKGSSKRLGKAGKKKQPPPESKSQDAGSAVAEIIGALTTLHTSGQVAVAGRVQVLRLDRLREELGDKWDRLSGRIGQVIDSTLNQYLSGQDLHWRLGEHAHLLVFGSLTPAEAEAKCALIRSKIEEFFRGTPELAGKIEIDTAVATVEGGIGLKPLDDLETLYQRLQLTRPAGADEGGAASADGQETEKDIDITWMDEDAGRADAAAVNWRADTDDIAVARQNIGNVGFTRRPVWDAAEQVVCNWSFIPAIPAGGISGSGGSILSAWSGGAMTLALDEATIVNVNLVEAKEFSGNITREEAAMINGLWYQVHFGTLTKVSLRRDYGKTCDSLNLKLSPSRITEIIGLPKKLQRVPFTEERDMLRKFTGEVAVCFDLLAPQIKSFHSSGVQWAGFSMRDTALDENAAIEAISRFVHLAEGEGLKVYARDLPTKNVAMAAIGIGVRYVFGKAVASRAESDGVSFHIEDVLADGG